MTLRITRLARPTFAALVGAALLLPAVACGSAPPVEPPTADAGALRIAAVGDSITDADSRDFTRGEFGPESWAHHAIGGEIAFAGGWARWGATTEEMARNVELVDAEVLVIMAGTNDVALGVPFGEVGQNLTSIAETIGAPRVLLCSIPPLDHAPGAAAEFNEALEGFARERGWQWVDAGAAVRTAEHRFAEGMASDGVHPTERGAKHLGETIRAALIERYVPPGN